MCRDLTSEKSDVYEFKMALFVNRNMKEFLLFVRNFQMNIKAPGTLATGAKIQYLCMLVRGKALRKLDTLSVEVGSTTSEHLKSIILGLGAYFTPVNALSKISVRCTTE